MKDERGAYICRSTLVEMIRERDEEIKMLRARVRELEAKQKRDSLPEDEYAAMLPV